MHLWCAEIGLASGTVRHPGSVGGYGHFGTLKPSTRVLTYTLCDMAWHDMIPCPAELLSVSLLG